MLYFDTVEVSEGIDVNKTIASKECDICHYCYFLNYSFKFQPNVCNISHDFFNDVYESYYEPIFLFSTLKVLIIAVFS